MAYKNAYLLQVEHIIYLTQPSQRTRDAARAVLRGLDASGLGPGFIYLGADAWTHVAEDEGYGHSRTLDALYNTSLTERGAQLASAEALCFWGVGGPSEVLSTLACAPHVQAVHLIELNEAALARTQVALRASGFGGTIDVYRADFASAPPLVPTSSSALHVLKGGTSGNLDEHALGRLMTCTRGHLYLDFFVDDARLGDAALAASYKTESVMRLAAQNLLALAERAALPRPATDGAESAFSLEIQAAPSGRVVKCLFRPPPAWSEALGVALPQQVEVFRSCRRHRQRFLGQLGERARIISSHTSACEGFCGVWLEL